jgi:hypothetical protein
MDFDEIPEAQSNEENEPVVAAPPVVQEQQWTQPPVQYIPEAIPEPVYPVESYLPEPDADDALR